MSRAVYIAKRESAYDGDEIIAVYDSEKEANQALKDYMKTNGCKNGTEVCYTVTGYRVRNYRIKDDTLFN